jgi:hypothetical protein
MKRKNNQSTWLLRLVRVLREPTIHFFAIAAAILLTHRLIAGHPRIIVISPALKADLVRRYQDQLSRPPTRAEVDTYMQLWKRDEALYREALREGIDRVDPTVRNILIGKMRDRALFQTATPEPSEADIRQYFEQHRDLFDVPFIYEHEYVVFPKNEPNADKKCAGYERKLKAGATPAALGLRSVAATVNRERIEQEFGPEMADRIVHLPVGQWQPLENQTLLFLVRMIRIQGGLPPPEVLRERLVSSWKATMEQKATERVTQSIVDRYRFQESSQ